ncbi:hypothetical protein SAMN05216436_10622 [bacterium A37T11]|nr:hypothetical protein SAMN05216436_10622 [bacterium A37T11]
MKKVACMIVLATVALSACNNHPGSGSNSKSDSDTTVYNAMPQGGGTDSTPANPEPSDSVMNNSKGTSN